MDLKVFLEGSIMQKGRAVCLGGVPVDNLVSPFDATVVTKLRDSGASLVDDIVRNIAGSEMTVAVNSVATGEVDVVLCNDFSGVISQAAAKSGLYYIHPTYGTVSRYGLVPMASSMDQIGVICKSREDGFRVLDIIRGFDCKDGAMHSEKEQNRRVNDINPDNIRVKEMKPEYSDVLQQIMQILSCAEISANSGRYDGIKFGHRAKTYKNLEKLYKNSRAEMLNSDIKLAVILGTMVLSQENYEKYYDKALRLRRLLRDSIDFEDCDVLRITNEYAAVSRLCGLPSVTVEDNTYMAKPLCENVLAKINR